MNYRHDARYHENVLVITVRMAVRMDADGDAGRFEMLVCNISICFVTHSTILVTYLSKRGGRVFNAKSEGQYSILAIASCMLSKLFESTCMSLQLSVHTCTLS